MRVPLLVLLLGPSLLAGGARAASYGARDVGSAEAVTLVRSHASAAIRIARASGLPAWAVRRVARNVQRTVRDVAPTIALGGTAEVADLGGRLLINTPSGLGLESGAMVRASRPRATHEVQMGGTGVSGRVTSIVYPDRIFLGEGEREVEFVRLATASTLPDGKVVPPNAWVMTSIKLVRAADGYFHGDRAWERTRVITPGSP